MTSTRSMAEAGIELVSTTPDAFTGVARRPSINTKFRLGPRPRKLTVETPVVFIGLFCVAVVLNSLPAGTNCGNWLRIVSTPTELFSSKFVVPTVTIGLFAS
jgi:hypothetical protein